LKQNLLYLKNSSPLKFFSHAFSGILRVIKTERNFRIHLVAAILIIFLGLMVGLTNDEWLIIVFLIFSVLAAETFNSAIEEICNIVKKKLNLAYEETKWPRNLSAGAVLILAIAAVIIGLIIFLPYFT